MKLVPVGIWQRLTGRHTATPSAAADAIPEISFSDLFGGPAQAIPQRIAPLPDPVEAPLQASAPAGTDAAIMRGWALRELAHWHASPVHRADLEKSFAELNATKRDIFIYRFDAGVVAMAEKPAGLNVNPVDLARAHQYLAFFATVARSLPEDFSTILAMGAGDKVEFVPDIPVFAFQKRRGNVTILAPDIDFLDFDFYEKADFADTVPYAHKTDRAIFIGGTTGGMVTPEVARSCGLPRLRAAKHFWGHERVEIRLPQIVQTTSDEARQILEEMPFCQGGRQSWKQQLLYRFLISIDGNGATCSRVAISLRSNSVLLKYESDELLYYFHGLQPWLHYIPIAREQDIERALDLDMWSPGALEAVAVQGSAFAARFLTRPAIHAYMAQLLLLYAGCFIDAQTQAVARKPAAPAILAVIAHIEQKGDTSADPQGWVGLASQPLRIEGFSIGSALRGWQAHARYQAVLPDGSMGPPIPGGQYCGTRGKQEAIHGFLLQADAALALPGIVCEGVFSDGFRSGPVPLGTPCQAPSRAALVAMRVSVVADISPSAH